MTEVEIEKLNQACTERRDKAIIYFLLYTGCRVSEMTELNREDLDLEKLQCIVHGKGNKERKVYLKQVAGMLIKEYLETRTDDNPALFIGRCGKRLQQNGVRVMLKRIAKLAGVEHVHPHKFRRTYATDLHRHGAPVQNISSLLGHDKLDTTMKYVFIDDTDNENAYRRFA